MTRSPHRVRAATVTLLAAALGLTATACTALDPDFGALVVRRGSSGTAAGVGAGPAESVTFAHDIRPLIARVAGDPSGPGCKECHYSTESSPIGYDLGGLDLSTLGALRRGGTTSGEDIVVAGAPESSILVQKLEGTYGYGARMPRGGPPYLRAEEIDLVKSWILAGALGADDE